MVLLDFEKVNVHNYDGVAAADDGENNESHTERKMSHYMVNYLMTVKDSLDSTVLLLQRRLRLQLPEN